MLRFMFVILLILAPPDLNAPRELIYMTESGHVTFTSSVPLHSFSGKSEYLTGMMDPQTLTVDFYLDLNTLKTGIRKRDNDMYQTLESETHPFAEFTGTIETPFNPESDDKQLVIAMGSFKIKGVEREKRIEGTLEKSGDGFRLEAVFTISLEAYNIEPPGILFYRVNDQQEIEVRADLLPRERDAVLN
jgi:polyisoprenoid-binding protein YceI